MENRFNLNIKSGVIIGVIVFIMTNFANWIYSFGQKNLILQSVNKKIECIENETKTLNDKVILHEQNIKELQESDKVLKDISERLTRIETDIQWIKWRILKNNNLPNNN